MSSSSGIGRRRTVALLLLVPLLVALYVGYALSRSAERVAEEDTAAVTERALEDVSDPVAALCAADASVRARLGPACLTAAQVATAPDDDPTAGIVQRPPADGRGITSTAVVAGRLLITYTDGATEDAGRVSGPPAPAGAPGAPGAPGVGIADSSTIDGRLVLVYTDGRIVDVGRVVGEPGRGVRSTAVVDGRLVVAYTDGTTEDAGPVPAGPAGPPGPPAELPSGYVVTFPDGTSETCTRDGGTDEEPTYSCTDRA